MTFYKIQWGRTFISKIFTWSGLIGVILLSMGYSESYAYAIYTDRGSWETAVAETLTTDTFSNSINSSGSFITFDSGVISTRSSTNVNMVNSSGSYLGQVTGSGTLTWDFPWEMFAMGFDVQSINFSTFMSGDFDGTGSQSFSPGALSGSTYYNGFVGIVGESNFDTILFSGAGTDMFVVNNLSFNNAPTIPEPATLALMGLGLAGIGYRRKKTA